MKRVLSVCVALALIACSGDEQPAAPGGAGGSGTGGAGAGGIGGGAGGKTGSGGAAGSASGGAAGDSGVKDAAVDGAGGAPVDAGACPPGAVCHIVDGLVIKPTPGADQYFFDWKVPLGTYSRVEASVRVLHGGWSSPSAQAVRYAVLYLERNKPFDMFAHTMFVKNSTLLLRHGFGMKPADKAKLTAQMPSPFTKGSWYELNYAYDTTVKSLVMDISTGGKVVASIKDAPNIPAIEFKNGDTMGMFLGFVEGDNPQEGASYGWEYRDLRVVLRK